MSTGPLAAAYRAFRSHRARRHGMKLLAELDDHILKDIGLSRCVGSVYIGAADERRHNHDLHRS
ncbi:DUF1127 domain-containing protein [Mesorhizobium sp. 1B3]|uniref:DUF1127 domain-containing protein n=1 Tax=Mesorhizobium sp. 1B3 TaxID=3243599 RepID=UPI003D95A9EF